MPTLSLAIAHFLVDWLPQQSVIAALRFRSRLRKRVHNPLFLLLRLPRLRFEPHRWGSTSRELTATVAVNGLNSRLLRFRFSKSPMKTNTGEPPQTLLLQYLMLVFIALLHHPRGQRLVSIAHIATWNMVVLMLLHESFEQLEF